MSYFGLSRGKAITVPLKGQFQRIQLSPEVRRDCNMYNTRKLEAGKTDQCVFLCMELHINTHTSQLASNLLPQEIYPGVSVTTVSGILRSKNSRHVLHPQSLPTVKQLWGQPSAETIAQALREV